MQTGSRKRRHRSEVSGSTATFDLPGAGAYLTWPTRNHIGTLASGYATLDCTEPVVAQVVFASIGSSGTPREWPPYSARKPGQVFQFPVLTPEATLGFAIANDTNAAADCRIVLEDPQRTNRGPSQVRGAFKVQLGGTAARSNHPGSVHIPRRDGNRFL